MISYMTLDNYSVLDANNNHKLYNLSKTYSIEIAPNSTYIYKHGFYFQNNMMGSYFIQIDSHLSKKLELESPNEYSNINFLSINI